MPVGRLRAGARRTLEEPGRGGGAAGTSHGRYDISPADRVLLAGVSPAPR